MRGVKNPKRGRRCRQCNEWFLLTSNMPRKRFCSVSCAAIWRGKQPKWKKRRSELSKAQADPEAMRQRSVEMWRNPEIRARLTEERRRRSNDPKHIAGMIEHNKRLWSDPTFRKQHTERTSEQAKKQWADPEYRATMSARTTEANKLRWADPDYKERVSRKIRIAKKATLVMKRQREAAKEVAMRPEARARSSERLKARWRDPEQRARMLERSRETAIRTAADPKFRLNQMAKLAAHSRSEEHRQKMSVVNKERWANPEYRAYRKALWEESGRAKQIERNKRHWADPKYKARVSKAISVAKKAKALAKKQAKPSE